MRDGPIVIERQAHRKPKRTFVHTAFVVFAIASAVSTIHACSLREVRNPDYLDGSTTPGLNDGGRDGAADGSLDAQPGCTGSAQCQDLERPLCVGGACVACKNSTAEISCASEHPQRPVCDTGGGGCVACVSDDHCKADAPICDQTSQACRSCRAHAECGSSSGVCHDGRCAPARDVIYVENSGTCPGDGMKESPFCLPQAAVARLADAMESRRILVLRGNVATFQITAAPTSPVYIYGQNSAKVTGSANPDVIRVAGAANLEIRDIVISAGVGHTGLRIEAGAVVSATQLLVEGVPSSATGIVVQNATFELDRSIVRNCGGGGVRTVDSAFKITNTVLDQNGTNGVGADLGAAPGKNQTFAYNTLLSHAVGLRCTGTFPRGLLVYNNVTPILAGCDVATGSYSTENPHFDPSPARPYHLTAESTCCVDRGSAADAPTHDLDGDPRPSGTLPDLGADELVP